jgi:hypothetical protein
MKFKSKVDWWMHAVFGGFFIANVWAVVGLFFGGGMGSIVIAATFTPLNAFLLLPMWLGTYYRFDGDDLVVKSGLGRGVRIGVGRITSVTETRNPISAPALSMQRMEIKFVVESGRFNDSIIISPADKAGFLEQLTLRNADIAVSSEREPLAAGMKVLLGVVGVMTALVLVGVGALFIIGEREPVVSIQGENLRIRALYGTTVQLADIAEISLIEQSMREIGAGARTNGYNGGAWRGHFTAGLLFVRPDSAPTIRIERATGRTIFISFRDEARTRELYGELVYQLIY